MKFNFSIIFLILYLKSFSQLSEKVNNLYQKLTSNNTLESEFIGYSGKQSENYLKFKEISKIANDDEILYMAENGNEAIKSYMSSILVDRKSKNLNKLFLNYINNDKEVQIRTGCMGYTSTITAELYRYVFYQKEKIDFINSTNEGYEDVKEYEKEIYGDDYIENYQSKWTKESVDSLLTIYNKTTIINDKISPKSLNTIFRLNDFKFDNYKRVKHFALKYPTEEILATLASFKNKEDLKLLHDNSENSILAISIMSLINVIKDRPAFLIFEIKSSLSSWVRSSSDSKSEKPIIAFIGVLISWLIFARNAVFSLSDSSAFSFASINLCRVSSISVMSRLIPIIPNKLLSESK